MNAKEVIKDMKEIMYWADFHTKFDCVLDITEIIKILNKYKIKANIVFDIEPDYDLTEEQIKLLEQNQKFERNVR